MIFSPLPIGEMVNQNPPIALENIMRLIAVVLGLCFATSAFGQAPPKKPLAFQNGVVVCVSPPAADVGLEILQKGGNAVDAAVAVGFVQAVTWPEAGNVGGGGFMIVSPGHGKEPVVIDYRETAPAAATAEMFAKSIDFYSLKVAGVPGTVRGFALAHKKFGKLPWKDVVLPAVRLAEDGFAINDALAKGLNGIIADPKTKDPEFRRIFSKAKGTWNAGDKLVQADLGKTLRAVAENGPDSFYLGANAELVAKGMAANGGLMTQADLAKYKAKVRAPIHGTYRGYDVYAPPPPCSGGIVLVEMLNVLENFDLKKNPRYSPETVHLMAETMRRAYLDRARHLGDGDFVEIPDYLTNKDYAKKVAGTIEPAKATKSEALAPELSIADGGGETTHYSVADKDGMTVSNTYTIENGYGCRVVIPGTGYILNNEMTDFNHRPGTTDRTGRIGTPANVVAPGKRMLSSQCPTLIAHDGKVTLVTGSPGGRTIINTVLCIVVNRIDYGMDVQTAVDAPRMHQQWFPDRIAMEGSDEFEVLAKRLAGMGHTVVKLKQGDGHSIAIDPKTGHKTAGVDHRRDGKAAGY